MTVAEGLATIVSACLEHFRLNEPLLMEARDAEALHQLRVATRRLRSAFSLFRPLLRDDVSAHIREEFRWLTGELGNARDVDVCLKRELRPEERVAIEEKREAAYDSVHVALGSERFRQLMLGLAGWAAAGEWRGTPQASRPLKPFASRRIDRLWSKVSGARRLQRMSAEDRHRLRIQVKKLRYAVEFMAPLHRGRRKQLTKFRKAVERLQEEMGLLNDIVVGRSLTSPDFWRLDPQTFEMDEREHAREAKAALRRMRKIGAYWRS